MPILLEESIQLCITDVLVNLHELLGWDYYWLILYLLLSRFWQLILIYLYSFASLVEPPLSEIPPLNDQLWPHWRWWRRRHSVILIRILIPYELLFLLSQLLELPPGVLFVVVLILFKLLIIRVVMQE